MYLYKHTSETTEEGGEYEKQHSTHTLHNNTSEVRHNQQVNIYISHTTYHITLTPSQML